MSKLISDIISIDKILEISQLVLSEYNNISCYLFGSYAKGFPTCSSDIDLLLLCDKTKYTYETICILRDKLQETFKKNQKYCLPIYGYTEDIDKDGYILFRQYINYGVLLSGGDMQLQMKKETQAELKQLEFTRYWTPMYQGKIKSLEYIISVDLDIDNSTLAWQYLFLIVYWYAKAELTLLDRQNSLNNFTLEYIYKELLKFSLKEKQKRVLQTIQKQRDAYQSAEYLEISSNSLVESFKVIQEIINKI